MDLKSVKYVSSINGKKINHEGLGKVGNTSFITIDHEHNFLSFNLENEKFEGCNIKDILKFLQVIISRNNVPNKEVVVAHLTSALVAINGNESNIERIDSAGVSSDL